MKNSIIPGSLLLFTFSVILFNFSSLISENPFTPSYGLKKLVVKLSPQGWGFFTRNPREQALVLYSINEDNSLRSRVESNSAASNLFGLSRKNRRVHLEFMRLSGMIPKDSWKKYEEEEFKPVAPQDTVIQIINIPNYDYHYLEDGKYLVLRYYKTPWLYKKENYAFDKQREFVIIEFSRTNEKPE